MHRVFFVYVTFVPNWYAASGIALTSEKVFRSIYGEDFEPVAAFYSPHDAVSFAKKMNINIEN